MRCPVLAYVSLSCKAMSGTGMRPCFRTPPKCPVLTYVLPTCCTRLRTEMGHQVGEASERREGGGGEGGGEGGGGGVPPICLQPPLRDARY
eukprot:1115207-Rhodomonas_salina.3